MVLFPHEQSGRFNRQQVDPTCSYEVNGDDLPVSITPSAHASPAQPFGGYTGPSHQPKTPSISRFTTCSSNPVAARKKTFRKTIVLVSLTCTSGDKPSSSKSPGIAYTVVTQIVVTLESQSCSPGIVADLVRQQVGYDVILLDSKCFPVLDTDTTCSSEYWKGTRKILAASKTLYAKLKGSSANPERAQVEIDLTDDGEHTPKAKRPCLTKSDGTEKLEQILVQLGSLEEILSRLSALEKLLVTAVSVKEVFECVICRDVAKKPVASTCCHRVVGCEPCVEQWVIENCSCPLCSSQATSLFFHELKGFDEVLSMASLLKSPRSLPDGREANSPDHPYPYAVPSPPSLDSDGDLTSEN